MKRISISSKERGSRSEERIDRALYYLARNKDSSITDYIQTSNMAKLDRRGIDFMISVIKGGQHKFVPLQVKSSWFGASRHILIERILKGKGVIVNEIPVVIVNLRDSTYDLAKKLEIILNKS